MSAARLEHAQLDEPDAGYVVLAGQRITRRPESERASIRARTLAMLMQTGNLLEHLTVAENVQLQLALAGKRSKGLAQRSRHRCHA